MRRTSLMDSFLSQEHEHSASWYQENVSLFLEVCELHGQGATQHHNQLVEKYIAQPSNSMAEQHLDKVTASGPPLSVLLGSLEKLRDRRAANHRDDIFTRYHDIQKLKATLSR
jgi:hypothetical protein